MDYNPYFYIIFSVYFYKIVYINNIPGAGYRSWLFADEITIK